MKRLQVRKSVAFILCFTLLLSAAVFLAFTKPNTAVYAENLKGATISSMTAYDTIGENNRLFNLAESHMHANMGEALSINCVKNLLDFNGNKYTLFELSPVGYIIFHNASGKFIEYTELGTSPYLNINEDLYYGGMGQFYYREDDTFYHTKLENTVIMASDIESYAENSQQLSEQYAATLYDTNLAYIEGNTADYSVSTVASTPPVNSARAVRPTARITRTSFFTNIKYRDEFGYVKSGTCGYVAANMLIAYNYFAFDYGLTNGSDLFNLSTNSIKGETLTKILMRLNGLDPTISDLPDTQYPGTVGETFPKLIKAYISVCTPNLSWNTYSNILEFGVVSSLDKGYPVALFGNYPNPDDGSYGNHAVVAYEYQKYGFLNLGLRYRVHYGWSGYSSVWLEATGTGSSLFLEVN